MSNKPKGVKRLVPFKPTKGERRHIAMVREAKKQGISHPGSKPLIILSNIIPTKLITRMKKLLKV